ncbi:MbcA/ParS/Xre antitoxin family protein [Maritalea mediterranea]|uniref:MbcA/ParS/Xre antitoxin family protein n=1 Tax=Maritalea mediterranea TaxID=2909667 RepID=A0ABS9E6D5_9HYPH|nr:MbcA/ParS/Xre antitoxin family protein [Maritalea mediterranea]MCF4097335.1 MbcA/ParS/Xre antitoxin family protein [Maritalea mediterranea]
MLNEVPRTPARPDHKEISQDEAAAMARATVNLFRRWGLSDTQARQLLGGMAPRTWARWKKGDMGRIDRDLAMRMSILMGVHKGLRYMFSDPHRGYQWVKKPNTAFAGQSALDVMLGGSIFDLARVRDYLDAERGGA